MAGGGPGGGARPGGGPSSSSSSESSVVSSSSEDLSSSTAEGGQEGRVGVPQSCSRGAAGAVREASYSSGEVSVTKEAGTNPV